VIINVELVYSLESVANVVRSSRHCFIVYSSQCSLVVIRRHFVRKSSILYIVRSYRVFTVSLRQR